MVDKAESKPFMAHL